MTEIPITTTTEVERLQREVADLRDICGVVCDTLGVIDDWLGMASSRQAATDSLWRLQRRLQQAGFQYNWKDGLKWRGELLKELNEAGFFRGDDDLMHYDPDADKQKPYRVCGNAQGPTLKEIVAQLLQARSAVAQVQSELETARAGWRQDQQRLAAMQGALKDARAELAQVKAEYTLDELAARPAARSMAHPDGPECTCEHVMDGDDVAYTIRDRSCPVHCKWPAQAGGEARK